MDDYINRHRPDNYAPAVDVVKYLRTWQAWYTSLQPAIRQRDRWQLSYSIPADPFNWGSLLQGGKNGVFLFVISLSWAVRCATKAKEKKEVSTAIEEMTWLFRNMTDTLTDGIAVEVGKRKKTGGQSGSRKRRA